MPKPKKSESKQDFLKRCTGELTGAGQTSEAAYAACNTSWDEARGKSQCLTLTASVELMDKPVEEGKPRRFMLTGYTGKMFQSYWGGFIFDLGGIKTKSKLPILRQHEYDRVVGFADKAWVEAGNFLLSGQFSGVTPDGLEVAALADEGYPWEASVGIWPLKIKVLQDKESMKVNGQTVTGPGVEVWVESEVREVSFVALGRDGDTAAIALAESDIEPAGSAGQNLKEVSEKMPEITLKQLEAEAPDLLREIRTAARTEGETAGTSAERSRVVELLEAGADGAATLTAIKEGHSSAAAFKAFFKAEKDRQGQALKSLETEAPGALKPSPPKDGGATYEQKVGEIMAAEKCSRGKAMSRAAKEFPDLHEDYIARVNGKK